MRRVLMVLAVLLATTGAPRAAVPAGCAAVGPHTTAAPKQCRYTATGPGTFVAATLHPWKIQVLRDGAWVTLAHAVTGGHPRMGPLATVSGDLVDLSIGCGLPDGLGECTTPHGGPTGTLWSASVDAGVPMIPPPGTVAGCAVAPDVTDADPSMFETTRDLDRYELRINNCRYVASGPSAYIAATTDPFTISISTDGGLTFTPVVISRPEKRAPFAGTFASEAGDIVDVSVGGRVTCDRETHVCDGTRRGTLIAQSAQDP